MPELPEVDHLVRVLGRVWVGRYVRSIEIRSPKVLVGTTPRRFARIVLRREVRSVTRRGKFIIVFLAGGWAVLMHLRMTGYLLYAGPNVEFEAFTRMVLRLNDGNQLALQDRRHLGRIRLVAERELWKQRELRRLGDEPLNGQFTVDRLAQLMSRGRRSVKEFLLDQTRIVGLGNIYASEALFRARINPRVQCLQLARSRAQVSRLHRAIRTTMRAALAAQGTTPTHMDFIDIDPFGGETRRPLRERFLVYDREGRPCRRCRSGIVRIRQGSRSTYLCRVCQR